MIPEKEHGWKFCLRHLSQSDVKAFWVVREILFCRLVKMWSNPESRFKAGLRDRHPIQDQSAGKQKPAVGDIISDGISGFRFEEAHHIIFAQINPGREKIYVQRFCQVLVDILDQIDDLRIVQTGVQKFYPVFNGSPVEVDHKFQK